MKKSIHKRLVSLLLCLTVMCGCFVCGFGSLTACAYENWRDAYAAYLRESAKNGTYDPTKAFYNVAYIDADDVPELLVNPYFGDRYGMIDILTFSGGKAVKIGEFTGGGGRIEYYKRTGVICSRGGTVYTRWVIYKQITGTTYKELDNLFAEGYEPITDANGNPTGEGPELNWTINGKTVTQEEYDQRIAHYDEMYGQLETCECSYKLTDADIAEGLGTAADTTTAVQTVTEAASEAGASDEIVLTETQKEAMKTFFSRFLVVLPAEYDSATPDVGMLLANQCRFGLYYPSDKEMELSAFYDAANNCYVIPADLFEQILTEIFNYSQQDVLNVRQTLQYSDGNYSFTYDPDAQPLTFSAVELVRTEYRTPYYYVEYADSAQAVYYAKLRYKQIGDGYYWSLYKNSQTKFWDVPGPTTESVTERETQTEAVPQNDGTLKIGNLVLDYWTLLLIGLAFIVAVLFIAIIVLAVKNGKRKKARAKKKAALPVQQPAVRSAAMPTPQPEQRQPEPQQKPRPAPKFRYRCNEADHGGRCEMCGTDVGMLMQIDAIKGEKVNTRYFCRNCAARIMRQVEQQQNS